MVSTLPLAAEQVVGVEEKVAVGAKACLSNLPFLAVCASFIRSPSQNSSLYSSYVSSTLYIFLVASCRKVAPRYDTSK